MRWLHQGRILKEVSNALQATHHPTRPDPHRAEETRARYLPINPGARVTIDSQPDNPQLKTLIAHLPVQPLRQVLAPGFIGYRGRRA
ncbi:hypothetical protein RIMD111065_20660 [Aeromonas hydrophila]|nr:hypothetical protein RIMD111065_20660 [Aeromonas hydrophila]